MSDPIVSNVRVTAQPINEPREGLPPCMSIAKFDGRACVYERPCSRGDYHEVTWGEPDHWAEYDKGHPGFLYPIGGWYETLKADDPAEAQAAFERGAEWVRTGEGP